MNSIHSTRSLRGRLVGCLALGMTAIVLLADCPTSTFAQQTDLPSAKEIIAKHVEATGGADKYRQLKSMRAEGTISIPQAGISGTIKVVQKLPDKILTITTMSGLGETRQGTDGKIAWENSTIMGPRVLEGEEAEQMIEEADLARVLEPEKHYKEMKCTGVEEIDGEKYYVVELVKNNGRKQVEYYSVDSGLLVRSDITAVTNMGDMKVETTVSDYRDVDGIKTPFKVVQKLPNGITAEIAFSKIEYNVDLADDLFAVPEEIREMAGGDSDSDNDSDGGSDDSRDDQPSPEDSAMKLEAVSLQLPHMT